MLKAIKIRLYPTEDQQTTINRLLGCCRLVYNKCLEHRNKIYEETKEVVQYQRVIVISVS